MCNQDKNDAPTSCQNSEHPPYQCSGSIDNTTSNYHPPNNGTAAWPYKWQYITCPCCRCNCPCCCRRKCTCPSIYPPQPWYPTTPWPYDGVTWTVTYTATSD